MAASRTKYLASTGIAILLSCACAPVLAQDSSGPDEASGPAGDIIVTGTRRQGVSELTSTTPVDVVSGEALASVGATNLGQALQVLAPSVNFPMNRASTLATSTKQVSLRGLSPDETLVLVNGKRWYPSAAVNTGDSFGRGSQATDLAALPIIALSRIEVLRDGASAQYGSDAVAGVVNVVLRTGEKGGEIKAETGIQAESGDGFSRYVGGWWGLGVGPGVLTLSGEWQKTDFVPLNKGTDTRQYYTPTTAEKEASAPLRNWQTGLGESESVALAATLDMPLSDKVKLYGLANYSRRKTAGYSPTRLPNSSANVLAVTPDGYQIKGWGKPRDYAGVLGLRYQGDKDTLDGSISYGRSDVILEVENSENPSYGVNTPRDFYLGKISNRQTNLQLDYTRELDLGLASPLTFSAGAAYRWDSYRQFAGQEEAYSFGGVSGVPIGVTGGGFIVPDASDYDTDRRSYGGYLGLEGDLAQGFTIGLAGRVEHFSDFGTAVTGKASARYAFSPAIAVRASVNNAYKAPSIGQLSLYAATPQQITPTAANPSGRVETMLLPSGSAIAAAAGAQPLNPEKALNFSGGIVLTPAKGLSLTVDGYYIRIKDRIALSATLSGTGINALLTAAGYPTVYGVQYFVNMGRTSTRGVDAVANYSIPLSGGSLDLMASATYNKNKIDKITAGSFGGTSLVNYFTVTSLFYNATPKYRLTGQETLNLGSIKLQATRSYYGKYGGANNQAPGTEFWFDPLFTADFLASFETRDQFTFSLGVRNAFGAKPEMVPNSGNGGRLSNSSLAIINPAGAYAYVGVAKKF